jgi:hypothetical protein
MDGTGAFSGQSDAVDTGVDTAMNIGTDERRMHVRAYNYWVSLLDGRAYPSIEDLNPENIEDFGPNSVLLDFTAGIENPAIAWLGSKLRIACELPEGVSSVADIPARSLLSRLTDHYMQIIANRAPIGFEAEFNNQAGVEIMYRGILMPFSSDDDTIDFIYGVINWKEAVDGATASSLGNEVERALAEVPAPRLEPTAPAWADGPSIGRSSRDADADVDFSLDDEGATSAFGEEEEVLSLAGFDVPSEGTSDEDLSVDQIDTSDGSLADWLASARAAAEALGQEDLRGRSALYRALSEAYDFALIAQDDEVGYGEILADARLTVQARSPMTPIVKLVFGISYDKTRLAEYALVLTHAINSGIGQGRLHHYLDACAGGVKAIVQAERAARKPEAPARTRDARAVEKARSLSPRGIVEIEGTDEFVILIARRVDDGHVAVLGQVDADQKALDKALRQLIS